MKQCQNCGEWEHPASTACRRCGNPFPPTPPTKADPWKTCAFVALGSIIAICAFCGSCSTMFSNSFEAGRARAERELATKRTDYGSIQLGDSIDEVTSKFGTPDDTQEFKNSYRPRIILYYGGSRWQVIFEPVQVFAPERKAETPQELADQASGASRKPSREIITEWRATSVNRY